MFFSLEAHQINLVRRVTTGGDMSKHNKRLRYWVQDTNESGHWELTGLMTAANVGKLLPYFEEHHGQVEIIEDENEL
jgi:hypothetical protein